LLEVESERDELKVTIAQMKEKQMEIMKDVKERIEEKEVQYGILIDDLKR